MGQEKLLDHPASPSTSLDSGIVVGLSALFVLALLFFAYWFVGRRHLNKSDNHRRGKRRWKSFHQNNVCSLVSSYSTIPNRNYVFSLISVPAHFDERTFVIPSSGCPYQFTTILHCEGDIFIPRQGMGKEGWERISWNSDLHTCLILAQLVFETSFEEDHNSQEDIRILAQIVFVEPSGEQYVVTTFHHVMNSTTSPVFMNSELILWSPSNITTTKGGHIEIRCATTSAREQTAISLASSSLTIAVL